MSEKKYNHAFDIAFTLENTKENPWDSSYAEILEALQKRVDELKADPSQLADGIGSFDTYELGN